MKTLKLFLKSVKEQLREPLMLGVTVTFGAAFMLIFGLTFGDDYYTYRVAVQNLDRPGVAPDAGSQFVKGLGELAYEDGIRMFTLEPVASGTGLEARLQKRSLFALVVIPMNFSETLASERPEAKIVVRGDPSNPGFSMVRMMIQTAVDGFLVARGSRSQPISLETEFIETKVKGGGEFTYFAPGLMLVAIFLLMIQCAMVIVREVQNGTILRLRLSRMHTWEFLLGISASQVFFAALMLPIMFGTAALVGFKGSGDFGLAFIVGVGASIVAIAFGLIIAAVSRTVMEAFLWGNLVTIPVVFLAGAFFPIPEHVLFTLGENKITLMDFLPSAPAVSAMGKVLIYGAGLPEIAPDLLKMGIMSALLFTVGVFLFSRTHLRRMWIVLQTLAN